MRDALVQAHKARSARSRERLEAYAALRRRGWHIPIAAAEIGVSVRTAYNYEAELQARKEG